MKRNREEKLNKIIIKLIQKLNPKNFSKRKTKLSQIFFFIYKEERKSSKQTFKLLYGGKNPKRKRIQGKDK